MGSDVRETSPSLSLSEVTIGVVTVLPHEYYSVSKVLSCDQERAGEGKPKIMYKLGQIQSRREGSHIVAVTLAEKGTSPAAVRVVQMRYDCPNLALVIMCGIACAIPNPACPEKHVRLGDIVVCGSGGIANYQSRKESPRGVELRSPPRPPSKATLEAVGRLNARLLDGDIPWEDLITQVGEALGSDWLRPEEEEDVLQETQASEPVSHPVDPKRRPGMPRLFEGVIASGDVLFADSGARSEVAVTYNARAIEMEGSGIAEAAHALELPYQVVRGTCDYGNEFKNDRWQNYAALIAACYLRTLIEELPVQEIGREPPASHLAESAYAAALERSYATGDRQPSSEQVTRIGDRLQQEIEIGLGVLEHEKAVRTSGELRALIDASKNWVTGETIARWLETLIRVEVLRAKREASGDSAPDLSRARAYLREAKDAIEGE